MNKERKKQSATWNGKEVKWQNRQKYSAEEKIKIVLEGLRGEESASAMCNRYGIHVNNYFKWKNEFIDAGMRVMNNEFISEVKHVDFLELTNRNEQLRHELDKIKAECKRLNKILA